MQHSRRFQSVVEKTAISTFKPDELKLNNVVVIVDQNVEDAAAYLAELKSYFAGIIEADAIDVVGPDRYRNEEDILKIVAEKQPDLMCIYRHLCSQSYRLPHGLGEYVNILTQATDIPVLVLPHPKARQAAQALQSHNRVMVMTDYISGDHALVSWGVKMCSDQADLYLCNIEDQITYKRYMQAITKVDELDTELARDKILKQLLKDAEDYTASCQAALGESHQHIQVHSIVQVGSQLSDYKNLVDEHKIDLLVMNSKDHDNMGMHGLIYPIAVAVRTIPLLLL